MKEQTLAVITTLALLVYFIVTLSPVSANRMVVDVFPLSNSKYQSDSMWFTTIYLNQAVNIYAQVSYVQSGTVPPSTFVWYVNGIAVKSDVIGSSTLTFSPTSLGVYNITVTVNGETNSELVTVTVIAKATPTQTPQPSVIRFYNDTHLALRQTLWAFNGYHLVGSFTATANDYLEFNIVSTNSDKDRPDDVFIVEFKIESSIHGTSYVSGTTFNQKVNLNYTDTYTISVAKFPFFSTVTVVGSIDLYRSDLVTPTPTQSNIPTLQPTVNTGSQVNYSVNPLVYVTGIIAIVIVSIAGLLVYFKKHKTQSNLLKEV